MVCRRPARRPTCALPGREWARGNHLSGEAAVGRRFCPGRYSDGMGSATHAHQLSARLDLARLGRTRYSCRLDDDRALGSHDAYIVHMSQYCLMCFSPSRYTEPSGDPAREASCIRHGRKDPRRDCGALLSHADASGGIGRESLDTEKRLFRVQAWDDRSTRAALDRYSLYRQEHRRASSGAPPVSCCTPLRLRYPPNLVFARFLFQSIAARVPTPSTNRAIPNGLPSFSASGSHASG